MPTIAHASIGLLLATVIPFLAMAESPTGGPSGIEGTIFVSPNRPGPVRPDVPSKSPVASVKFVVKKDEKAVASFTTDAEGKFKVALPPGHYVIAREGAPPRIGRWRFEAEVTSGAFTKVDWTADSGMR